MKIDGFVLDLHSKKIETTAVSRTFVDELQTQNAKSSKKLRSIADELEFVKRLQYEMLNQLISLLQFRSCSCMKMEYKSVDINSSETQSFTKRRVTIEEKYIKSQKLDVAMSGFVRSGGKKIEINMNLSFSSTFVQAHSIDKTLFYDPLVISLDSDLPNLDTKTFDFDIDMDGNSDQISMLKKGSGFLALDKNSNGSIDDGYELFGTQNGNGFLDLKRFDSDNNGWIDEQDPILDSLRIWIKNRDEDSLVALGEVGIGAIYLGYEKGSFDIRDEENTLGKIKSNGLYLNEDGTSGLVSQVDFAKRKKELLHSSSALNQLLQSS